MDATRPVEHRKRRRQRWRRAPTDRNANAAYADRDAAANSNADLDADGGPDEHSDGDCDEHTAADGNAYHTAADGNADLDADGGPDEHSDGDCDEHAAADGNAYHTAADGNADLDADCDAHGWDRGRVHLRMQGPQVPLRRNRQQLRSGHKGLQVGLRRRKARSRAYRQACLCERGNVHRDAHCARRRPPNGYDLVRCQRQQLGRVAVNGSRPGCAGSCPLVEGVGR
jgi:hypothetical protein